MERKVKIALLKKDSKCLTINEINALCEKFSSSDELVPMSLRVPISYDDNQNGEMWLMGFCKKEIFSGELFLYRYICDFIESIIYDEFEEPEDKLYKYNNDIWIYLK